MDACFSSWSILRGRKEDILRMLTIGYKRIEKTFKKVFLSSPVARIPCNVKKKKLLTSLEIWAYTREMFTCR
jgi:hypothetical protein